MNYTNAEKLGMKPFELLMDQDKIAHRVAELGKQITSDYASETPVFLGVLKGCLVFTADLIRRVKLPLELEFVSAASYREGTKQSKEVKFGGEVSIPLEGRHVLLVEGVVDSGKTISTILKHLKKKKPASVEVVTLIDKPTCHRVKLDIKYRGFTLGNDFVIGFGLDNTQKYRNLPFIGRLIEQK